MNRSCVTGDQHGAGPVKPSPVTVRYERMVGLALLCLIVGIWLLLPLAKSEPTTAPILPEVAAVPNEPHLVEPPKSVEAPPEASMPEAPAIKPEPPLEVTDADAVAAGMVALAEDRTPSLEGRIRLPYEHYLDHVQSMGGVLAVFEQQTNRLIGRMQNDQLVSLGDISGFSPRARDVSGHLPAATRKVFLEKIRQSEGAGAYRFLVLMPVRAENRFIGLLAEALGSRGLAFGEMERLVFEYRSYGENIVIVMLEAGVGAKTHNLNRLPIIWH